MYFSASILLAVLPFLVSTRATLKARQQPVDWHYDPDLDWHYFSDDAWSLVAEHGQYGSLAPSPVVAFNSNFYVHPNASTGPSSDTVCELEPDDFCPTASKIVVANFQAGLNVATPGGQSIYVSQIGELKYTAPHSNSIPPGAKSTGFFIDSDVDWVRLRYIEINPGDWLACPGQINGTQGLQVLAGISGARAPMNDLSQCQQIVILLLRADLIDNAYQAIKNYTRPHNDTRTYNGTQTFDSTRTYTGAYNNTQPH